MSRRSGATLLALLALPAALRAQDEGTHPADLTGVWAHSDTVPGTAALRWSVIRFQRDGEYRAVQIEAPTTGEIHADEPVTGRWAALATDVRGTLLCTRLDGAKLSSCNVYRVGHAPTLLVWKDVSFTPADTAMLRRMGMPAF